MNRDKLSILLSIIAITIPLLTVVYVVLEMSKPQTGVPRNNGLEAPQFFLPIHCDNIRNNQSYLFHKKV